MISNKELLNLSGKTAIVTGGSVGIGYGITYRLAEAGAKVLIANRNEEDAKKSAESLSQLGYDVRYTITDVANESDVKNMVAESVTQFGHLDILVNNAGIFPFSTLKDLTADIFDKTIAINLRGVFLCMKYAAEQMITQGQGGRIINITSIDALHPSMSGLAHYDASKHGVWGFTKNTAIELAKHNIWVNAVAPGGVRTPGVAAMSNQDTEAVARNPEPTPMDVPMGRIGVPDDIGKTVLFLASDMASYITGSQIVVDGGYLLK